VQSKQQRSKTKTQKYKNIMKNYNLIERLWKTDSHEKQSPQRFGRYAVMLIMLLTLGVGQMWGLSDGSTWYEGNSPYLYFNNINSNYNGVSLVQGRQWGYGSGSAGSQGYAMTAISNTKLYYIHQSLYDHYTTQCFVDRNGGSGWTDWSSTAVASRVTTYAHNYTNSYNLTYTSDKKFISIFKTPSPEQASHRPPFTLKLNRPGLYPRIFASLVLA
jgi:hypothetical protein